MEYAPRADDGVPAPQVWSDGNRSSGLTVAGANGKGATNLAVSDLRISRVARVPGRRTGPVPSTLNVSQRDRWRPHSAVAAGRAAYVDDARDRTHGTGRHPRDSHRQADQQHPHQVRAARRRPPKRGGIRRVLLQLGGRRSHDGVPASPRRCAVPVGRCDASGARRERSAVRSAPVAHRAFLPGGVPEPGTRQPSGLAADRP